MPFHWLCAVSPSIDVYFLPALIDPSDLSGRSVVLIDVLRATTTIITALSNGAAEIIPSDEIDLARATAENRQPRALLGGERNGMKIPGFDLGNSPLEYSRDAVTGKTIVLATTNGTRAMFHCRSATEVLVGSFANLSATVDRLRDRDKIALVCSGTDNRVTQEDILVAGSVAAKLVREQSAMTLGNDQAAMAVDVWEQVWKRTGSTSSLARAMGMMHGGRNLVKRGMTADIEFAAAIDRFDIVPHLDLAAWSIRNNHQA